MAFWLLKTEPSTYSWGDLVKAKRAVWDGVRNPTALRNMREMKVGDLAFIYHTGDEKAIVGIAKVVQAAYPDPKSGDESLVVVDLEPVKPLKAPVTLASIKADTRYAAWALVRIPRLSVMPVDPEHWKQLSTSS
jgi:predicted RNA-binding protein with PUA-like domain